MKKDLMADRHAQDRFLLNALCAALAAVFAAPVLAACDNTAPASGSTVTCSGASNQTVNAAAGSSSVTVNIQPNAAITSASGVVVQSASTVSNAGTVNASGGGVGIAGQLDDNLLTNQAGGVVATTGAGTSAIVANGNRNQLVNYGLITTQNGTSYGLAILPGAPTLFDNVLTNFGTIQTNGPNAHAMFANQNNRAQLSNSGSILTNGNSSSGLRAVGSSNILSNSGSVKTTGTDANAVYMQGDGNSFTNSGTVETTGAASAPTTSAAGVFSNTAGALFTTTITNTGTITSAQSYAIRGLNGQETVINAGTLSGGGGTAISLGGGDDTLILRTGSVIHGIADGGAGNDTLQLQGAGTASNPFVNFETLLMQGTAWNWTGSGAFNNAQLQSGTFNLSGTLTAPTAVLPGATLTGGGRLAGNLTVQGTVQPGATPGSGVLTVDGNYSHAAGAVLAVTQGATSADRLAVGGTATLSGGTVQVLAQQPGDYVSGSRVPIVSAAGGLAGTFGGLQAPSTLFTETFLSYDANNAYLSVLRTANFASVAGTPNQAQVAAVLDSVQPAATGTLRQATGEIEVMSSAATVRTAFDSLAGGLYPTYALLGLREQAVFARSLTQRLAERRGSASVAGDSAADCEGAGCDKAAWVRIFGIDGQLDGGADAAGADTRTRGVAVGVDRRVSPHTLAGIGLELAHLDAAFNAFQGQARADSYKLGVYANTSLGDNYLAGVLSYGTLRGRLQRQIDAGGLSLIASGNTRADLLSAHLEAGRHINWGRTTLEPLATLAYAHLRQQGLSESGAGEAGLNVQGQSLSSLQAGLGARIRHAIPAASGTWTLEGRARWLHEFADTQASAGMSFVGAPAATFTVQGAEFRRNSAQLGFGVSHASHHGLVTQLSYEALLGGDYHAHALMLRLRYFW
jgi:outer membrane autotransporter protein